MNHLRSGSDGGEAQSSPPQLKTSGIQKRSKHGLTLAAAGGADVGTMAPDECLALDLTPKHHIRSPIIEETESSMEEELTRPRGQNEFNPPMSDRRLGSLYGDAASDASTLTTYRFRINDNDGGRSGSPEPAYNETKASILRR